LKIKPADPFWHQLLEYPGGPKAGQILVSFDMSAVDHFFEPKIPKEINFNDFIKMSMITFEVNVLGFRQLKSMGILPVKKAFVELDFKALLPRDNDLFEVENKQTEPGPPGSDPTINTLLQY
jgi:hypothetical protein